MHSPLYFRNFVFGVEDSLVSTVGLLSGIAIGGVSRETIFLTGIVLILVEAFSMAAGSFLSESSVQDITEEVETERPLWGGVVMFASYFAAGFVPLAPYIFVEGVAALYASIAASLAALFLLGVLGGSLSNGKLVRRGVRMMFIGGIAIVAGLAAGALLAV